MHGAIQNSNISKKILHTSKKKPAAASDLRRWFPWIVSLLVVTIISAGAYYIYQQAEDGIVAWWPYPLFALFVTLVFVAQTRIYGHNYE